MGKISRLKPMSAQKQTQINFCTECQNDCRHQLRLISNNKCFNYIFYSCQSLISIVYMYSTLLKLFSMYIILLLIISETNFIIELCLYCSCDNVQLGETVLSYQKDVMCNLILPLSRIFTEICSVYVEIVSTIFWLLVYKFSKIIYKTYNF